MKKIYLSVSRLSNTEVIDKLKQKLDKEKLSYYQYVPGPERYNMDELLKPSSIIIVFPPMGSFLNSEEKVLVGKGNFTEADYGIECEKEVYCVNETSLDLFRIIKLEMVNPNSFTATGELILGKEALGIEKLK